MNKAVIIQKLIIILVLAVVSVSIIVLGGSVLHYKKQIDSQIISITKQSSTIEEVKDSLSEKGFEFYEDDGKLYIKVNGLWNKFYYSKYLGKDLEENNDYSGTTTFSKE